MPVLLPEEEMDYAVLLNRALPSDIKVLGWTDVLPDFSARLAEFRIRHFFAMLMNHERLAEGHC